MIINKNDTKDFIAMLPEGETRFTDVRNAKYVYVFRKEGDKVTFAHVKKDASDFGMYQIDCNVVWSIRRSINKWLSDIAA